VEAPLLGRDAVLRRVDRLVADFREGRGSLLWLRGDAGIGKSRLLAEVGRRAEGALVLRAAGWEDPGTPAFWLWTQVLRAAATFVPPSDWDDRASRARVLLEVAPSTDHE
jgi:hypothetical protein